MNVLNETLEKYIRFLWVLTLFLGIEAILTISKANLSFIGSYVFLIGVLNLLATYGLFRKKIWGWKLTAYGAILSLIYLIIYLVINGIIINLIVLYLTIKFRAHLGAKENDSLLKSPLARLTRAQK